MNSHYLSAALRKELHRLLAMNYESLDIVAIVDKSNTHFFHTPLFTFSLIQEIGWRFLENCNQDEDLFSIKLMLGAGDTLIHFTQMRSAQYPSKYSRDEIWTGGARELDTFFSDTPHRCTVVSTSEKLDTLPPPPLYNLDTLLHHCFVDLNMGIGHAMDNLKWLFEHGFISQYWTHNTTVPYDQLDEISEIIKWVLFTDRNLQSGKFVLRQRAGRSMPNP